MANLSVSLKNMEINVFGMKFRLDVIILLAFCYFVLWGHVICSCSKGTVAEAFEMMDKLRGDRGEAFTNGYVDGTDEATNATSTTIEKKIEGFVGANTNNGESSSYSLSNKPINTSKWFEQDLTNGGKGAQNILNRKQQPIPLPEGEMLMFANTEFKPDCCPNAYSNSMGCACMTTDQYNYLINRGGNNVPYSEY
jgi:hypothetical protein